MSFYQESQLEQTGAYSPNPTMSYFYPHVEELVVYFDHSVVAPQSKAGTTTAS